MAYFGDGLAVDTDLTHAAESAVAQALGPLAGRRPDLFCVFVAASDPAAVEVAGRRAMELSGAVTTLGCSAEGVIGDGRGVELTSAVSAWAAVLPDARVTPFHLESPDDGEFPISGMPDYGDHTGGATALLLADPVTFPVESFIADSNEKRPWLPFVGGLVSSEQGAQGHRLFVQGRTVRTGAVGVVLDGNVTTRTMIGQGSRPVGPPMTVTRAEGTVIYELAGQPALTRLEEVVRGLDPQDRRLVRPALVLGIAMDEYAEEHGRGDFIVRTVVGADGEQGAVAMLEPVAVGRTARLHVHDARTADAEMEHMLAQFREEDSFGPSEGALMFSCNGRGSVLFATADHEVQAVRSGLGVSGVAGFFAQGEIGPVGARNYVHGYTVSVLAFGATKPGARGEQAAEGNRAR